MANQIKKNEGKIDLDGLKDCFNGVVTQKTTRLIFGALSLASDVFLQLNIHNNDILEFLYHKQRDYSIPLKFDELPDTLQDDPSILEDLMLIGVLQPIHDSDARVYNLVGKQNLTIPPLTSNNHRFMINRYSSAYLIKVTDLPKASGYRAIRRLKTITIKSRNIEKKTKKGVFYIPFEEHYELLELSNDTETKKQFCQFNVHGFEKYLELSQEIRNRFLLHSRLELRNSQKITELELVMEGLKEKYENYKYAMLESVKIAQTKYSNMTKQDLVNEEITDVYQMALSDDLKIAITDWLDRLRIVELLNLLLKSIIKARNQLAQLFNKHNLDHLEKLFSNLSELTQKVENQQVAAISQALRDVLSVKSNHSFSNEEEVLQQAYHYYWEDLSSSDQTGYTLIRRFYYKVEGMMP